MATVYTAPQGPPEITLQDLTDGKWQQLEQLYLDQLAAIARDESPAGSLVGEVIRFPRGDGYAQYMVWSEEPLALVWLEMGDAWRVEGALERGLNLDDVRAMVEQGRALAEIFSRRAK